MFRKVFSQIQTQVSLQDLIEENHQMTTGFFKIEYPLLKMKSVQKLTDGLLSPPLQVGNAKANS